MVPLWSTIIVASGTISKICDVSKLELGCFLARGFAPRSFEGFPGIVLTLPFAVPHGSETMLPTPVSIPHYEVRFGPPETCHIIRKIAYSI